MTLLLLLPFKKPYHFALFFDESMSSSRRVRQSARSVAFTAADPSDDGNELLAPENVVMLVASTAMVAVLGDAIATVASGF